MFERKGLSERDAGRVEIEADDATRRANPGGKKVKDSPWPATEVDGTAARAKPSVLEQLGADCAQLVRLALKAPALLQVTPERVYRRWVRLGSPTAYTAGHAAMVSEVHSCEEATHDGRPLSAEKRQAGAPAGAIAGTTPSC